MPGPTTTTVSSTTLVSQSPGSDDSSFVASPPPSSLPSHSRDPSHGRNIDHGPLADSSEVALELQSFSANRRERESEQLEAGIRYEDNQSDLSFPDDDEENDENDRLLREPSELEGHNQMKGKNRGLSKRRSAAGLTISTGQNGNHRNNDDAMSSRLELRRKDPSIESPSSAQHAARVMASSSFTLDDEPPPTPKLESTGFFDLPERDRRNFILLVMLYFLQGIPMGLAMGSVPFLLKPLLSYGQIGVFSLASYPYSLKLLWSPIVDALWSKRLGRRKSWIAPIQFISGLTMLYLGGHIEQMMQDAGNNGDAGVWSFTKWWFLLVFFCATQDIAVDGWALTLLSPQNISYASTAQTVGLTAGQFLSHTVFLALNSADFANRWFRTTPGDTGFLTLGGYLTFWGWIYIFITIGLVLFKREELSKDQDGIMEVYRSMWSILKLKNIQLIIVLHLIGKIGFQANDAVTSLKLLDKGFGQDNMALVVLIDFPIEIALGYYAGKWSNEYTPMRLWCWAFVGRLIAAVVAQATVMVYPDAEEVPAWYVLMVIGEHVLSTFMSTIMFVAVSAFHARISDPAIGGTYMTLLATVSNLGGTFPKYFILKLVDALSRATCIPPSTTPAPDTLKGDPVTSPFSCALEADKHRCLDGGGSCHVEQDGYYMTNIICVIVGAVTLVWFIRPTALKLQDLPLRAWRITTGTARH